MDQNTKNESYTRFNIHNVLNMKKNIYALVILISSFVIQDTYVPYFIDPESPSFFVALNIFTFALLYSMRELALSIASSKLSLLIFGLLLPLILYTPYILATEPDPILFSMLWCCGPFGSLAFLCTVVIPLLYFIFICYVTIKNEKWLHTKMICGNRILFLLFAISNVAIFLTVS